MNEEEIEKYFIINIFKNKMYLESLRQGMTHEEAIEFVYNMFKEE